MSEPAQLYTDDQMHQLERTLAYQHAVATMDALSPLQKLWGLLRRVKNPDLNAEDQARLDEAVHYLDWRKLLARQMLDLNTPTERVDPDYVAVLNEDGSVPAIVD